EGSDAVWFISQGVILDELAQGRLITLPTQARFLSGAVGVTQRQGGGSEPGLEVLLQQLIRAADEAAG
ncbi:MAG: LysR family transcriptional regulator, partial [Paracoccaceae bacterium]|nr:LysR family transcriptional regulator [Paracoccaceae bacterium]